MTPTLYEIRIRFDPNGLCISHTVDELGLLIETLDAMEIRHGVKNSMMAKLQNALQKLESAFEAEDSEQMAGLLNAAIGQLGAFINEAEAQGGKHIAIEDACVLSESAGKIISRIRNVMAC